MTVERPIRILLAEDHALVRQGVRLILDAEPDLEVVAQASDGAEAVAIVRDHEVDLAVLDVGPAGLVVQEMAPGLTRAELQSVTAARLAFAYDVGELDPH